MATATMTSKGQITIPVAVREKLRLKAGSKVDFAENKAGEIVLRPKTGDIRELRGIFKREGPPVSLEEMNRAVKKAAVDRFLRPTS